MSSTPLLKLHERHRAMLDILLATYVPAAEVWAYGSRVTGEAHDGSDLDIVLRNPNDLEQTVAARSELLAAIESSTIPILVDVGDWATLPAWLRTDIERMHVVLRPACSNG